MLSYFIPQRSPADSFGFYKNISSEKQKMMEHLFFVLRFLPNMNMDKAVWKPNHELQAPSQHQNRKHFQKPSSL